LGGSIAEKVNAPRSLPLRWRRHAKSHLLGHKILGLVRLVEEDAAIRLGATEPLDNLVGAR
jgi:hypothetical protein